MFFLQAHGSWESLKNWAVAAEDAEHMVSMNLFVNRLTSTSIGLSPYQMFIIHKDTILTVSMTIINLF